MLFFIYFLCYKQMILFNDQELPQLMIISYILMVLMSDSGVML